MLRKIKSVFLPMLCCLTFVLIFSQMPAKCYGYIIEIDVSPNVLNIQSASTVVTVHTDIKYALVVEANVEPTVFLNEVPIHSWKSDDRGYFVAQINSAEIKGLNGLIMNVENTLTLTGYTKDGDYFSGTDYILVINNVPDGMGKK